MGIYTKTARASARRRLQVNNAGWPAHMVSVHRDLWPARVGTLAAADLVSVWRSYRFLAQVFTERAGILRLSVCRTELTAGGQWVAGITWDELQQIKTECGFADRDAVEIYPAAVDVVNVANFRHLWILPDPLTFAWRAGAAGQGGAL